MHAGPQPQGYDLTPRLRADPAALAALVMTPALLTLIHYFGLTRAYFELFPGRDPDPVRAALHSLLWWAGFTSTAFLVVPMVWLKARGEALSDHGWRLPRWDRSLLLYPGMYLVMLGPILWASTQPAFLATYPFFPYATSAPGLWLIFEAAYLTQFLALEFFFRGWLIFTLRRTMGEAAVLVSMIPYCMIHFHKPFPETLGAIVAGIVLGLLSLRTGSIAGGVFLHASVALTMDLLAIWRKGGFAPGATWW